MCLQGKLTDGNVFDSSYERNDPIEFELGSGQVIKGLFVILLTMLSLRHLFISNPSELWQTCYHCIDAFSAFSFSSLIVSLYDNWLSVRS